MFGDKHSVAPSGLRDLFWIDPGAARCALAPGYLVPRLRRSMEMPLVYNSKTTNLGDLGLAPGYLLAAVQRPSKTCDRTLVTSIPLRNTAPDIATISPTVT